MHLAEAGWFSEYQYRSIFTGISHDQYLDEPLEVIQWMTRIHKLVKKAEAEEQ